MKKSILQTEKECICCAITENLHWHHVYGRNKGLKEIGEREGFMVWLCLDHHTGEHGVHSGNKALDTELKRACQAEWEKTHTRAEWLKLIGKSYLED